MISALIREGARVCHGAAHEKYDVGKTLRRRAQQKKQTTRIAAALDRRQREFGTIKNCVARRCGLFCVCVWRSRQLLVYDAIRNESPVCAAHVR